MIAFCEDLCFLRSLPENPITVKMNSLYNSYGADNLFLSFWKGDNGTVIMRFYDEITLYYNGGEKTELLEFLAFLGAKSIFCSSDTAKELGLFIEKKVYCLSAKGIEETAVSLNLSYRRIYDILNSDTSGEIVLPEFEEWYVDFCHRVRHNTARSFSLCQNSVVITGYETENFAIICGVATLFEYRNKGKASANLKAVCNQLASENKTAVLFCGETNLKFYQNNGFSVTGEYTYAFLRRENELVF